MTSNHSDPSGPKAPPSRRILLVDDEAALLYPMSRYFQNLGCTVDVAQEPEEAEALLGHRSYDLVILDLRLTRLGNADGIEVLRELRKQNVWTSAIVLSAYVGPEVEHEARRLGADAVLRKPVPLPELAQVALALMGERA